ncbi:MAG: hypothetical protein LC776_08465, partial [Acidobacteria bacterium]|nr:hypothetical protein [Acidobacteriota bacterium]
QDLMESGATAPEPRGVAPNFIADADGGPKRRLRRPDWPALNSHVREGLERRPAKKIERRTCGISHNTKTCSIARRFLVSTNPRYAFPSAAPSALVCLPFLIHALTDVAIDCRPFEPNLCAQAEMYDAGNSADLVE